MEIIKYNYYINDNYNKTYYGNISKGDIFMVYNKDILNPNFVSKNINDTKYFIVLGYSQKIFGGIVINSLEYNPLTSVEIPDISLYDDILWHESYFGCESIIEIDDNNLYYPTKNKHHLTITEKDLSIIIDKLYLIANNYYGNNVTINNLEKYNIFKKSKIIFESMILKFKDFIKFIYNK